MSSTTAVLFKPASQTLEQARAKTKPLFHRFLGPATTLIVLVYALPIVTFPPGRDQGTYLEIGQSLLNGKHLYIQLWDNKPPGIFAVYACVAKIFGRVMWSAALVDTFLVLAISYLLFRFVEHYLGRIGAAVAVVAHVVWCSNMRYWWIGQPETFQVLCALAALLLLISRNERWRTRCFVAGLLCGVGFWLKYNFVAFIPFLLIVPFLDPDALGRHPPRLSFAISRRDWLSGAAFVGLAFAIMIAVVMGWIALGGGWPAMRESQFQVLPRYATIALQHDPHYLLKGLIQSYFIVGPANIVVTLAGLVIGWRTRDLQRFFPLFLVAAAALGSAVMQMRFHDYYFQICYPFFAALWGYVALRLYELIRVLTRMLTNRKWRLVSALVWVLFANAVFWPIPPQVSYLSLRYAQLQRWWEAPTIFYANYPQQFRFELLKGQLEVVDYIQKHSNLNDPIYLWGSNSLIYFLANRQPPTRFVLNLGVMAQWGQPTWKQETMQAVRASQPRLIIVTRGDAIPTLTYVNMDSEEYLHKNFIALDNYITESYKPVAEFDGFVIYERHSKT